VVCGTLFARLAIGEYSFRAVRRGSEDLRTSGIRSNCASFSRLPKRPVLWLLAPGVPKLKEWADAGFTFAWISAFVAHYLAKDGLIAFMPLILLVVLFISYVTGPASRQWQAKVGRRN
jgi:hypothetical protein